MGLHSMMAAQCAVSTVSPRSDAGLPRDSPANGFRKEQLNITGSVWIPRHHELKYGAPGTLSSNNPAQKRALAAQEAEAVGNYFLSSDLEA
jgi:hypothetical protein